MNVIFTGVEKPFRHDQSSIGSLKKAKSVVIIEILLL